VVVGEEGVGVWKERERERERRAIEGRERVCVCVEGKRSERDVLLKDNGTWKGRG
jgi:hypothetical protein